MMSLFDRVKTGVLHSEWSLEYMAKIKMHHLYSHIFTAVVDVATELVREGYH